MNINYILGNEHTYKMGWVLQSNSQHGNGTLETALSAGPSILIPLFSTSASFFHACTKLLFPCWLEGCNKECLLKVRWCIAIGVSFLRFICAGATARPNQVYFHISKVHMNRLIQNPTGRFGGCPLHFIPLDENRAHDGATTMTISV